MEKIAIITGAGGGISSEIAKEIERRNIVDKMYLLGRNVEKLRYVQNKMSIKCEILPGNLTDSDYISAIAEKVKSDNGSVSVLVNGAGVGYCGKFENLSETALLEQIRLDCTALTEITKKLLPYMSEGSFIINLASAAAFCPQPGFAVYAAAKSYVLNLSYALSSELASRRITVTAVCPGPVDTPFLDTMQKEYGMNPKKRKYRVPADRVARHAVKRALSGKKIAVCGFRMKIAFFFSKILPAGLIMKFFRD